jgi:predicted solute-binding protein
MRQLWADEVLQLLETEHIDAVLITHEEGLRFHSSRGN